MQKLYPSSYITRPSERINEIRVVECFAENACFSSPDIKLLEWAVFSQEIQGTVWNKVDQASASVCFRRRGLSMTQNLLK